MPPGSQYVRRSQSLVTYWKAADVVIYNYATGEAFIGSPVATAIVSGAGRWMLRDDVVRGIGESDRAAAAELIDRLIEATVLRTMDGRTSVAERSMERLSGWNPFVGFFHRSTKDVEFGDPDRAGLLTLSSSHPPGPKRYPDAPSLALPDYPRDEPMPGVLLRRRTWRRFGNEPITNSHLATLLGLTWGVQQWVHASTKYRLALKTSPSGGALHSIEAYALAFNVDGIEPGTYHYDSDKHRLELLSRGLSHQLLPQLLPAQHGFHEPALLVFMTSNFARVYWKYRNARAYRVVLMEAGHFAQTFCLVATWLGLAPFCTAALGDSAIEQHLGIDRSGESVLYAVGVGTRPHDCEWAPFPDRPDAPSTEPSQFGATVDAAAKTER